MRDRSTRLQDEVGEQQSALTPAKTPLVDPNISDLGRNPSGEENLQLNLLAGLLDGSCLELAADS
jgi:hypothetical protein